MKKMKVEAAEMRNRKPIPNTIMVVRQIDGLREVMRRMKASSQSLALDPVFVSKLEKITKS